MCSAITPSPHSILPVEITDLPTIADLLHAAKISLTINRLLWKDWPNHVAQKAQYFRAVEGGFKNPSIEDVKVVDDQGDIVGYLALSRKNPVKDAHSPVSAGKEVDRKPNFPDDFNTEVLTAVCEAAAELDKDVHDFDHFEVTYITVKLQNRNHGIGSDLMRVCFEKANAEGIPLTVCAEPAAYEFFLGLGFQETKHVDIDLSKWAPPYSGFGIFRLTTMIWSPDD